MKPSLDSIFCLDAASKDDVQRLSGPSVDTPPTEWSTASPHELEEMWPSPVLTSITNASGQSENVWMPGTADYGPTIETWDAVGTSHTGYTAGSKSWLLDVDLPAGWYTRISERKSG